MGRVLKFLVVAVAIEAALCRVGRFAGEGRDQRGYGGYGYGRYGRGAGKKVGVETGNLNFEHMHNFYV